MVLVKLGYNSKSKYNWEVLPNDFEQEEYNGKKVIRFHERLWEKVKNIIYIRTKGYDAIVLIDGKRRTGKSTLAKQIAYLLYPNLTIENYVSGLDTAYARLEEAEVGSVLIFDEGSLIANNKEMMTKLSVKLHKIIDVIGQKKLTLIFCMPTFFDISKAIATTHSLFLLHTYTDKQLNRGFFLYFSARKKKKLYEIGKKNFGSYDKPPADWNGRFVDFTLPFEKDYLKLKMQSLKEAIEGTKKSTLNLTDKQKDDYREVIIKRFFELVGDRINDDLIYKGFGMSRNTFYRRKKEWLSNPSSQT